MRTADEGINKSAGSRKPAQSILTSPMEKYVSCDIRGWKITAITIRGRDGKLTQMCVSKANYYDQEGTSINY